MLPLTTTVITHQFPSDLSLSQYIGPYIYIYTCCNGSQNEYIIFESNAVNYFFRVTLKKRPNWSGLGSAAGIAHAPRGVRLCTTFGTAA